MAKKNANSDVKALVMARVTRKMPKKALEARIAKFLGTRNMCVLATCSEGMPRATPLEYHSDGTTLYMMVEAGRKVENIRANPNVSVGVYAPYAGWMSVKGAQITGVAKILTVADGEEFVRAAAVYPWKKFVKDLGLEKLPANVRFLKVETAVIEYVDMSLKLEGYAATQVWARG
jgi:predicted pyridoxine 5'-phosphate oxidase superfamily flavin-nucleotide-binding protein